MKPYEITIAFMQTILVLVLYNININGMGLRLVNGLFLRFFER